MCAEHQPQQVEKATALDKFHTSLLVIVLRLVFDTAALLQYELLRRIAVRLTTKIVFMVRRAS